jgi:hypothetical protein
VVLFRPARGFSRCLFLLWLGSRDLCVNSLTFLANLYSPSKKIGLCLAQIAHAGAKRPVVRHAVIGATYSCEASKADGRKH